MLNNDRLADYANALLPPLSDVVQSVIAGMVDNPSISLITMSSIERQHLGLFSSIMQPKKILEIGTHLGLSAYYLSQGLAPGGHLYTIEVQPDLAEIARRNLELLGKTSVVTVIEGDARRCLQQLESHSLFDIIFINADKKLYPDSLKWAARNLRVGGLLIANNTFAWGYIADPACPPDLLDDVVALRKFNYVVSNSPLFISTLLPTVEGMTLAMRR